ncbi:MAG: hypothetical protein GY796_31190 [Chloroflexi bacterium]|nr:hypothetical protein [Chloroflexota bacterium]
MKTRPFIITAAAGAAIQIIWTITITIISYSMTTNMFESFSQPGGIPTDPLSTPFFGSTMLIAMLGMVCGPALYLLMGGLYAYLHHQDSPTRAEDSAIGGGASAAFARFLTGIVSIGISIFMTPLMMAQQLGPEIPVPAAPFIGFSTIGSIAGGFIGICVGVTISGALGAVGGAITAAILNR